MITSPNFNFSVWKTGVSKASTSSEVLKKVYEDFRLDDFLKNSGAHKKRAKILASQVRENFSQDKIYSEFVKSMEIKTEVPQDQFEEVFVVWQWK